MFNVATENTSVVGVWLFSHRTVIKTHDDATEIAELDDEAENQPRASRMSRGKSRDLVTCCFRCHQTHCRIVIIYRHRNARRSGSKIQTTQQASLFVMLSASRITGQLGPYKVQTHRRDMKHAGERKKSSI